MRAVFIRHGQSTANVGMPCDDIALAELTPLGFQQAAKLALSWTQEPSLIVTSAFLRTQQTAAPTVLRFPNTPVHVWEVHEFTYLQPARWNGTTGAERLSHIDKYWHTADPDLCDGDGAESFACLLRRAADALARLQAMPGDSLVYVFSHAQFMQAVRSLVANGAISAHERMKTFRIKSQPDVIANAEAIQITFNGDSWNLGGGAELAPSMQLTRPGPGNGSGNTSPRSAR